MIDDPGSIRGRFARSASLAWRMYCALEVMVPHQGTPKYESLRHVKPVDAPLPWNGAAAELALELHAEVRRLEVHLRDRVSGHRGLRRGGSSENTRFALEALPKLCEAVDDQTVVGVAATIDGWLRRVNALYRPEAGLHRLPRQPGEKEQRCPFCNYQTMRWNPSYGVIVCVNPGCRDEAGERPRWVADFEVIDNETVFFWKIVTEEAA